MKKIFNLILCFVKVTRFFPVCIYQTKKITIEEAICNDIHKVITRIEKKSTNEERE